MKFQVKNIYKNFGEKEVLNNISFEVESGTALGLLGRNGAGKTTTLRIIMGVFPPLKGDILVDDEPIDRSKLNIGYLPEERGLYPKKPILEQLIYFASLKGMKKKEAKKASLYWLEKVEMSEYKNAKLDTLSKGNQQKIQLACALVNNPDFVILDEPFSGLDPVNAMLLKNIVKDLIKEGKIVLFSSHQMNYIEEFCDSIAIINKGKIVLNGKIKDIKRSYDRKKLIIKGENLNILLDVIKNNFENNVSNIQTCEEEIIVNLNKEEDKASFIEGIAKLKIDFDSISVYEPSLNDIFVEYTED